jgi:hypothetical protein
MLVDPQIETAADLTDVMRGRHHARAFAHAKCVWSRATSHNLVGLVMQGIVRQ